MSWPLIKWRMILLEANHKFQLRKCSMTRRMICLEFINIKPSCHISSKLGFRQICGVWTIGLSVFVSNFATERPRYIDVHSLLVHSLCVRRKHGSILNHGKRVAGYHMTLSEKVRKGDSTMMPTAFQRARRREYSEKNQAYSYVLRTRFPQHDSYYGVIPNQFFCFCFLRVSVDWRSLLVIHKKGSLPRRKSFYVDLFLRPMVGPKPKKQQLLQIMLAVRTNIFNMANSMWMN